jgi:LmbE family N-acetylglucosaminyl deacetylase
MTPTPSSPTAGVTYGRNVLFLGAHCDDIEIGCGGTAAKLADAGHTIAFAVAAHSGPARKKEACAAAALLNLYEHNGRLFLGKARDNHLSEDVALVRRQLVHIRDHFAPDTVFIHHGRDTHKDHKTVFEEAIRVFNRQLILLFQIPKLASQQAPFVPNHFEDVSHYLPSKLDLCRCHASQGDKVVYLDPKQIQALATIAFNSAFPEAGIDGFAEGFVVHVSRSPRDTAPSARAPTTGSVVASSSAPAIRAFTTWHHPDIADLIGRARRSIDIVDTYYDEATTLVPLVAEAVRNGAETLRVTIYMLDPRRPFGAQRLLEKATSSVKKAKSSSGLKPAFRALFRKHCEELRDAFEENSDMRNARIRLRLYAYPTMPGLRLIAVDETDYIVGWFPLHDTNPNFCCLLLSKTVASLADLDVIAKIEGQLHEIQRESRAIGNGG